MPAGGKYNINVWAGINEEPNSVWGGKMKGLMVPLLV